MPVDITKITASYASPLTSLGQAATAIQTIVEQQARWRSLVQPPSSFTAIRALLDEHKELIRQQQKVHVAAAAFGSSALLARSAEIAELSAIIRPSSAFLEEMRRTQDLRDKVLRVVDSFGDIRRHLQPAPIPSWITELERTAEQVGALLTPSDVPADEDAHQQALEVRLDEITAGLAHLPPTGATPAQLRSWGLTRHEWIHLFLAAANLLLALITVMQTHNQGRFARQQAAQDQAVQTDIAEQDARYQQRLLAALEALADHAPPSPEHHVIGPRPAKVRSVAAGGTLLDIAHPDQLVQVTGKQGRWFKISYRNHLEDRHVEGWVLKHYVLRADGFDEDQSAQ